LGRNGVTGKDNSPPPTLAAISVGVILLIGTNSIHVGLRGSG